MPIQFLRGSLQQYLPGRFLVLFFNFENWVSNVDLVLFIVDMQVGAIGEILTGYFFEEVVTVFDGSEDGFEGISTERLSIGGL